MKYNAILSNELIEKFRNGACTWTKPCTHELLASFKLMGVVDSLQMVTTGCLFLNSITSCILIEKVISSMGFDAVKLIMGIDKSYSSS